MYKCNDCKDTGKIELFYSTVECEKCKTNKKINSENSLISAKTNKKDFSKLTNKEVVNELDKKLKQNSEKLEKFKVDKDYLPMILAAGAVYLLLHKNKKDEENQNNDELKNA